MKKLSLTLPKIQDILLSKSYMIVLMLLGLTPTYFVGSFYLDKIQSMHSLTERLGQLHSKSDLFTKHADYQKKILLSMQGADPHYLDTKITSLPLLESEIKKWQHLAQGEGHNALIEKRLDFLQSDKNKLKFTQGEVVIHGKCKEVEEKQKHPVEISEEDLKKILSTIDGVKIHSFALSEKKPHFLFKCFDITKKTHPELKEKVYTLSMELLQRDLLPE